MNTDQRIPSKKEIENIIKENYREYLSLFIELQSFLFSSIYKRYQSLESGHLVLSFAKIVHQNILRLREHDLNVNISFENFWENHNKINSPHTTIINIAKDTGLPKETARRKIINLIKLQVLNKKNEIVSFSPSENYKKKYNEFMPLEINKISTIINFLNKKLNLKFENHKIISEIKQNYSFFWYHYLSTELKSIKIWKKKIDDLEVILIFMQCAAVMVTYLKKNDLFRYDTIYNKDFLNRNLDKLSVSATSISDLTGIPRATCSRKLDKLVKMNVIAQDRLSKRYYVEDIWSDMLGNKNKDSEVNTFFIEFYFSTIKSILQKTSN